MPELARKASGRKVAAVHGKRAIKPDPGAEVAMAAHLRDSLEPKEVLILFQRFGVEDGTFNEMMRRVCLRALVAKCGNGVRIGRYVSLRNPETFEIGDGVFIGDHVTIQGRHDGRCVIGAGTWLGPHAFLDARDLVLGRKVGWGPGAKVLGSAHTGLPKDVAVIDTELSILPVRVGDWADIGTGAVLLPGVRVGRRTVVGAGAVVTRSLPANCTAAGVPARPLSGKDPD